MNDTYPMAVVTAPGKIKFQERRLPLLGDQDVLIKVKTVTLCGSDLHIFKGKHPVAALPVPVGHEIAGEVQKIGARVSKLKPGDRVAVEPVIACGVCYFCQRGKYHLCTDISFQYRRGQGGLTPYFVLPEQWAHPLPPGISYLEGAMLEPLSVAVHAMKKSALELGHSSAIFGAGAIGLLLLKLIRLSGGGETFVIDINKHRLEVAKDLGASEVFNNQQVDAVAEIMEHTDGLGVDRAFEAAGLEITLTQALQVLKKGGLATLLGIFETQEITLPANLFIQKEIALAGSQGYNWDFQTAIKLVSAGQIDLEQLVTHKFTLLQSQEAFQALTEPGSQAIKVAIEVEE